MAERAAGEEVPTTAFTLGDAKIHQFHMQDGRYFAMSELAVNVFKDMPHGFGQEVKRTMGNSLRKVTSYDKALARTASKLEIPSEDPLEGGHTLLPAETVETLLKEKRRDDLVYPFRLAQLKLTSQEAAGLMAGGDYEAALPGALDAVKQGQKLFRPEPAIQLFPLYLLAAQANLGLRRTAQCEDFLGLASWLTLRQPEQVTRMMRSQLSRLYGQLYSIQSRDDEALKAFAEDVQNCAVEYGPEDVRTSLGYYNLAKVLHSSNRNQEALRCWHLVVRIWLAALAPWALGEDDTPPERNHSGTSRTDGFAWRARDADEEEEWSACFRRLVWRKSSAADLAHSQLLEVVDMLRDILEAFEKPLAAENSLLGDTHFALGLVNLRLGELPAACASIRKALGSYRSGAKHDAAETVLSSIERDKHPRPQLE